MILQNVSSIKIQSCHLHNYIYLKLNNFNDILILAILASSYVQNWQHHYYILIKNILSMYWCCYNLSRLNPVIKIAKFSVLLILPRAYCITLCVIF